MTLALTDLSEWIPGQSSDPQKLSLPSSELLDLARADFLMRSKTVWQAGRPFHTLRPLQPDRAFDLAVDCLLRAGVRLSADGGPLFG